MHTFAFVGISKSGFRVHPFGRAHVLFTAGSCLFDKCCSCRSTSLSMHKMPGEQLERNQASLGLIEATRKCCSPCDSLRARRNRLGHADLELCKARSQATLGRRLRMHYKLFKEAEAGRPPASDVAAVHRKLSWAELSNGRWTQDWTPGREMIP